MLFRIERTRRALQWSIAVICLAIPASAQEPAKVAKSGAGHSQMIDACQSATPKACLAMASDAMGGSALPAVKSIGYQSIGHTLLVEQSYRQEPFIASYERTNSIVDLSGNRLRVENTLTWPESDPGQSELKSTMVGNPEGCVQKAQDSTASKPAADRPCSLAQIDWVRDQFTIAPWRILTTAESATDLHFEKPEVIRSTPHTVLAFTWQGVSVRLFLNPFNHLPDALETLRQFQDHWYQWGDVRQRIYQDNWVTVRGVRLPTNLVEERNGVPWKSTQLLDIKIDTPVEGVDFAIDQQVAARGAQSKGWERPFNAANGTELAPGIVFFPGAWNSTLVKQDDGVVVLEAPISGTYTGAVLAEAHKRFQGAVLKAVLSTSDSWPHVGGVRQAVASKLPVYLLDLNRPLLDRLTSAKHQIHPDLLAQSPQKPNWKIVSGRTLVGTGPNRMELYPLRGPSTERQYMVYFPEHRLLYASDTLTLNQDGSLYDPELMREVSEAVQREGLHVETVFAMHEGPTPWSKVQDLLKAALKPN